MIHDLDDVRSGFDVDADVVVVGSGPGGAVAAANLAEAGKKVVLLEAGPALRPEDMTRDAPLFLARYFWEGGLRMIGGTTMSPSMQARCLGGSSIVNSAIMLPLPKWIREIWTRETGVDTFLQPELDAAYDRIFAGTSTGPTPMSAMGRRNLLVKQALDGVGVPGKPLPRAVVDCDGSSDCLTGCASRRKQSMDISYVPRAVEAGATVYTCAHVERVLTHGARATGVEGRIVDPRGRREVGRFRVRADQVVIAAGAMHTPVILQKSGIHASGTVGRTLFAHIGGGALGVMEDVVDPWVGATQGWGAISEDIPGMKFEGLWASPSVLLVRWGDVGLRFVERLGEIRRATVIAVVYRGNVTGRVKAKRNGMPDMKIWIPESEVPPVVKGIKLAADSLLKIGAQHVHVGMPGLPMEMRSVKETDVLVSGRVRAKQLAMTMNHVFGTCRMSRKAGDGTVDESGKVHGVEGLYLADASIFPSPSAVNPQATVMALSDLISRKLGELS